MPPDTAARRRRDGWFYVATDWFIALLVWIVFFLYRRSKEGLPFDAGLFNDPNFYLGALLIPLGWVLFYALFDEYRDIYRLSRLATLARTLLLSFFGVLFLFFTVILDDAVSSYRGYYRSFFTLFTLQFTLTALA
ncbi:MAG: sugar transferase, partial [Bacteroidota bacterium]